MSDDLKWMSSVIDFFNEKTKALKKYIKKILAGKEKIRRIAWLPGERFHFGIVTTRHTNFIAFSLASWLNKKKIRVSVFNGYPAEVNDIDFYIVICPQMFEELPPSEKYIAFQMEQSISSRWFTDEYIAALNKSIAVLDYSYANIQNLKRNKLISSDIHHLPVGGISGYIDFLNRMSEQKISDYGKSCDVLFYGDVTSPRRRKILESLKNKFDIRLERNLFGVELVKAVLEARVVVNIHYYEGALLETTRIYECLSIGTPVVSESSTDISEYEDLVRSEAVIFTPPDDVEAMIDAIEYVLNKNDEQYEEIKNRIKKAVSDSEKKFGVMLSQALKKSNIIELN